MIIAFLKLADKFNKVSEIPYLHVPQVFGHVNSILSKKLKNSRSLRNVGKQMLQNGKLCQPASVYSGLFLRIPSVNTVEATN